MGKYPLSDELLFRTGRIDSVTFKNGEMRAFPRSLSRMNHGEFRSYVDDAVELICKDYLALRPSELLKEAAKHAGVTYEQAFDTKRQRSTGNG